MGDLMMGLPSSDRKKLTPASRKILEKLSSQPSTPLTNADPSSHQKSSTLKKRKAASSSGAGPDEEEGKGKVQGKAEKKRVKFSAASERGITSAPIAAPLPRVIKERMERKAGYEDTKEEVTRWQSIVKANREAPTIVFTSAKGDVSRVSSTMAIVANHVPQTELESEVAALLEAAGAASSKVGVANADMIYGSCDISLI